MEKHNLVLNPLPVKTWNFLKMNASTLDHITIDRSAEVKGDIEPVSTDGLEIPTGLGKDMDTLIKESGVPTLGAIVTEKERACRKVDIHYSDGEDVANAMFFAVAEGASATVFMDLTSENGARGTAALQTKLHVNKGASITLIQMQHVSGGFTVLNDIGAVVDDGGHLELIQIFLSEGKTYEGVYVTLRGDKASMETNVGYKVFGDDRLDMNYVARHIGKATTSNMNAYGSLADRATKLFRGTIDFVNGAAGSVGSELEEILLIDDDVINQTIPLILCDEEDVAGNHGASIGKPDEELLIYLASRGIDEATAYEMLADAKLYAVTEKIEDATIQTYVNSIIKGE